MLANYRGYLQVDHAAPAYNDVFAQSPGIIEVGCMAHARRYFSSEALPIGSSGLCAGIWRLIKQLYGIERVASDLRQLDAPASTGPSAGAGAAVAGETASVSAGAAGGGVTEESARCGYRLRDIAQLGRLDPLHWKTGASKSTIMARSRRYDRSCWAGRTGCSRAVKRQRTGPPSCGHSSRPASTCRSIPSSTCAMSSRACRPIRRDRSWN